MTLGAPTTEPPGKTPAEPERGAGLSFDEVYARYGTRVLNLAYRMTGQEDTARDLAQDVWLRVYERLGTFEARSDVFTWIYRITVNHVLNHLKRERRVRWMDLLDLSVGEAIERERVEPASAFYTRAPGPDKLAETDDRARRVWNAVQALDAKYRVPLVLFHYEDQSYQQIAETLSLSMAAVETRIHRARKQLAKTLGPLMEE